MSEDLKVGDRIVERVTREELIELLNGDLSREYQAIIVQSTPSAPRGVRNPSRMDRPGAPSAIPDVVQALGALGEFGGGLAILLGFLTPLGALGVLCTMIGAWFIAHRSDVWLDFGSKAKNFEYAALYGALALTLILTGPGRFSLDALIWGKKKR